MDNEILFTEKQKFTQWWFWLMLIALNAFGFYSVFKQVILGQPLGDNHGSNEGLLSVTGLMFLITIFYISHRLDTIIKKDGIYVRFFPFHFKSKYYAWDTLTKAFIREYAPIKEYGGWGLRLRPNGTAYNLSGNKGLQLEFKDAKNVLIGTNKPEELAAVLSKIGQLKP